MFSHTQEGYALARRAGTELILGDINVHTLFIWGNKDIAIGPVAVRNGHKYMKGEYRFLVLDAGHWLIQTNYSEVKHAIIEHLSKYKTVPNDG